jgi:hypothetical protein
MPVISATQEVEAENCKFEDSLGKDRETLISKTKEKEKCCGHAQVVEHLVRPWVQA